ncbi:3-hydroxybutyryl-CoA dehydrogenase [Chitinophaga skermanii]|uniref:3-hydroxybutyryl-CoA dehydrogenase n=1 Tax=Chitinophaga skermanii TaxID=331697 RepID=A0A327QHI8_9BACT|nr:3-hydroxyacyl-CoA dehydrogenase family protein [Chitinophaga skermanii]RAJ03870.1 3-hydroxybutyryl-CoA dehydrogenase [Chitinophaga skermanii]
MKILVIGDEKRWEMLNQKGFGEHEAEWHNDIHTVQGWERFDWVIDLVLDDHYQHLSTYILYPELPVLGCTVKMSLDDVWPLLGKAREKNVFGANFLPGFIDRNSLEVSAAAGGSTEKLDKFLSSLQWPYEVVKDEVGMVAARVVCMIINEAYNTAGEGTASREDIDISMKLGTNYPYGPFEWAEKIGIKNVYELLSAVHQRTGNERYAISEYLQQAYEAAVKVG